MNYLTYLETLPQKLRDAGAKETELAKLVISFHENVKVLKRGETPEENEKILEGMFNHVVKTIDYGNPKEGDLKLSLTDKETNEVTIFRVSSASESDEKVKEIFTNFGEGLYKRFQVELQNYNENSKIWQISKIYGKLV